MVHPVTYVNKVLLYGEKVIELVNVIAEKSLYSFPRFSKWLTENEAEIAVVEAAFLVDIVGVALTNGVIAFLNLKKDQVVFSVRQKCPATTLAFSGDSPLLASGDSNGNVLLWDLNSKSILYKF